MQPRSHIIFFFSWPAKMWSAVEEGVTVDSRMLILSNLQHTWNMESFSKLYTVAAVVKGSPAESEAFFQAMCHYKLCAIKKLRNCNDGTSFITLFQLAWWALEKFILSLPSCPLILAFLMHQCCWKNPYIETALCWASWEWEMGVHGWT